jgi:hypothetical protein
VSVPGATSQSYLPSQWKALEAAWHAACQRGDPHPQPSQVPPASTTRGTGRVRASAFTPVSPIRIQTSRVLVPTPFGSPDVSRVVASLTRGHAAHPVAASPTRSRAAPPSVTASPTASRTASPSLARTPDLPPQQPTGHLAYAVRARAGEGQISDELEPARDVYLALQDMALHPVLVVRRSLTEAVSFVEGDDAHYTVSDRVSRRRRRWIREKHRLFDGNVPPLSPIPISDDESEPAGALPFACLIIRI